MALQDEIDVQSAQIKTDSYPMSIGELSNLYRDGELDIHPEFQRMFRWTPKQKSRLIESILLGIWDVVDGMQRLSTIFQFMGILKDEQDEKLPPLMLEETKFLPSLKNKLWEGDDPDMSFSLDQRLYIKRARIDVNIVKKESDAKSKYELFMRLNTGGTPLEPQEVRNCMMIMAFPQTYEWIRKLSEIEDFSSTTALTDRLVAEQYPMELVTRFIAFRTLDDKQLTQIGDIGEYLNDRLQWIDSLTMEEKEIEEAAFRGTFERINKELADDAFRKYDSSKKRFLGGFSIAAFEAIAMGIGFNVSEKWLNTKHKIREHVYEIWSDTEFTSKYSGSGVRASSRLPKIVPIGRKKFSK